MPAKEIETPIEDLKVSLNKVVEDNRGYLAELLPGGTKNELVSEGRIGNLYLSVGGEKGEPRGGHYHETLVENFFTVSGQALWLFKDYREESSTKGETFSLVLGEKDKGKLAVESVDRILLPEKMAQILVPTGVYHTYYSLSEEPVRVVACGSHPYDPDDYVDIDPEEIEEFKDILPVKQA